MGRIVVEDDERLDARRVTKPRALLPGGVTPTRKARQLGFRIGRIIDEEVRTLDQPENVRVQLAGDMFGVGDVAECPAAVLDAVAGGAVGMIEGCRANADSGVRLERLAGLEIHIADVRLEDIERYREERRLHAVAQHVVEAMLGQEMPRPEAEAVLALERRAEERQPGD